jgi:hypothetical protein
VYTVTGFVMQLEDILETWGPCCVNEPVPHPQRMEVHRYLTRCSASLQFFMHEMPDDKLDKCQFREFVVDEIELIRIKTECVQADYSQELFGVLSRFLICLNEVTQLVDVFGNAGASARS